VKLIKSGGTVGSLPFAKPKSDRIAVKVINHPGDEMMKVIRIH
jgi:hypothetical protein